MTEKIIRQVCKCEKCGNEAEMTFTCTLEEVDQTTENSQPVKIKAHGTCSHCGSEADMWIDYDE